LRLPHGAPPAQRRPPVRRGHGNGSREDDRVNLSINVHRISVRCPGQLPIRRCAGDPAGAARPSPRSGI